MASGALESLLSSLADELRCALCLEQFKDPRVLSCLHTFCCECLGRLVKSSGVLNAIGCPLCRHLTMLTADDAECDRAHAGVRQLPRNNYLANIIEKLSSSTRASSMPPSLPPLPPPMPPPPPPPSAASSGSIGSSAPSNPFVSPEFPPTAPGMDLSAFGYMSFEDGSEFVLERLRSPPVSPPAHTRHTDRERGPARRESTCSAGESTKTAHTVHALAAVERPARSESAASSLESTTTHNDDALHAEGDLDGFGMVLNVDARPDSASRRADRDSMAAGEQERMGLEQWDDGLITADAAADMFHEWMRSLWFAPSVVRETLSVPEGTAAEICLYAVPFYAFDVSVSSKSRGRVCTHRGRRDSVGGGTDEWRQCYSSREQLSSGPHITCCVRSLQSHLAAINDWHYDGMPEDVVGRDVPVFEERVQPTDDAWMLSGLEEKIRSEERQRAMEEMKESEHGLAITEFSSQVEVRVLVHTLIYLPVYICSCTHQGKQYSFAVNAQTGSSAGQRPFGLGNLADMLSRLWS